MGLFDKNVDNVQQPENQQRQEISPNQIKWIMGVIESLQKANADLNRKIDSYSSKIADMEKRMNMLTMSMGRNTQPKPQQGMNQNSFQQAAYQQQGVPQGLPQGGQQFQQGQQQGLPQQQPQQQFQQMPQQQFQQMPQQGQGYPQQQFQQMPQQGQGYPQQDFQQQIYPQQDFSAMPQPQPEVQPMENVDMSFNNQNQ